MTQMYQNDSSLPRQIIYAETHVVTTEVLAKYLGVSTKAISNNFKNNAKHYKEGVHYFLLKGEELRDFKYSENFGLVNLKSPQLYLWTERGCFNHVKSIGSDESWDLFKVLIEDYFKLRKLKHKEMKYGRYYGQGLNIPDKPIEVIRAHGQRHEIGRMFNINNAMYCYESIKFMNFLESTSGAELEKDLEMLMALNPNHARTINILKHMHYVYNQILTNTVRNRQVFYEFQNN